MLTSCQILDKLTSLEHWFPSPKNGNMYINTTESAEEQNETMGEHHFWDIMRILIFSDYVNINEATGRKWGKRNVRTFCKHQIRASHQYMISSDLWKLLMQNGCGDLQDWA